MHSLPISVAVCCILLAPEAGRGGKAWLTRTENIQYDSQDMRYHVGFQCCVPQNYPAGAM